MDFEEIKKIITKYINSESSYSIRPKKPSFEIPFPPDDPDNRYGPDFSDFKWEGQIIFQFHFFLVKTINDLKNLFIIHFTYPYNLV